MADTENHSTSGLLVHWDTDGTGGDICRVESSSPPATVWTLGPAGGQTITGGLVRSGTWEFDQNTATGSVLFEVQRLSDARWQVSVGASVVNLVGGTGSAGFALGLGSTKSVIFRLDADADHATDREWRVYTGSDVELLRVPENGEAMWSRPASGDAVIGIDLTSTANSVVFAVGQQGYRGQVQVYRYRDDAALLMPGFVALEDKNGGVWYLWAATGAGGGSLAGNLRIGPTLPNTNDDKPTDSQRVCAQT